MGKRCQKGKSCGASCIERADGCFGGLSALIGKALASVREKFVKSGLSGKPKPAANQQQVDKLIKALNLGPSERMRVGRDHKELMALAKERKKELWEEIGKKRKIGGAKAKAQEQALMAEHKALKEAMQEGKKPGAAAPSTRTKGAKITAGSFDSGFSPIKTHKGSADSFDWEGSINNGRFGGKGAFGVVLFTGDGVVKRGEVGANEADIIRKVGNLGLGPSLIYGETGKKKKTYNGFTSHYGRIAMTKVEGIPLGKIPSPNEKLGGVPVSDQYWRARAELHRAGIAHNDAHGGNFFVSNTGRGKFVDFGMSQDNPRAALSEAIGGVMHRGRLPAGAVLNQKVGADFQAQSQQFNPNAGFSRIRERMPETLGRISDNLPRVEKYLTDTLGMSPSQAAIIMSSGIQNPDRFYTQGVWSKVSDSDAKKMIDLLYEGV